QLSRGGAAGALPDHAEGADLPVAARQAMRLYSRGSSVPGGARSLYLQSLRDRGIRQGGLRDGYQVSRRVLRRGTASHPRARGGAGPSSAREQILAGHVEALRLRLGQGVAGSQHAIREATARLTEGVRT